MVRRFRIRRRILSIAPLLVIRPRGAELRWDMAPWQSCPHPQAEANSPTAKERVVWGALLFLWALAVTAGTVTLIAHTNTAGDAGTAPQQALSMIVPEGGSRFTLLMFVHPKCPCSRASVRELSYLMAACRDAVDARVWFYRPATEPDSWAKTDLWRSAASIPGGVARVDAAGRQAAAFGAVTSGQVLLYDRAGQLCFRGGITAGRGHDGDNTGRAAVERIVRGERSGQASSPVFGCRIAGPPGPDQD